MLKPFILLIAIMSLFGCKRKMTTADIETELKKALTEHLYHAINYDSARIKYDVQTVTYFEDKTFFECEFRVRVTAPNHDTTGTMTARISKDFSKVNRKQ